MKRPVILIIGAAAAAFLLAGIGASAHSGLSLSRFIGAQSVTFGDEATGTRVEPSDTQETQPEATETPEAQPATEPAETPDTEVDSDTETDDDNGAAAATTTKHESGDHETGDHQSGDHEGSGD